MFRDIHESREKECVIRNKETLWEQEIAVAFPFSSTVKFYYGYY